MTLRKVYETVRKVIIYEIVCNITGERYIGSTIKTLLVRIRIHKNNYNNCCSKKIIDRGDYNVNELEIFYTKFELAQLLKEQYWMDNTHNINIKRAYALSKHKYEKQFYAKHKKRLLEKNKNWVEKNKEHINKRVREKPYIICECGSKIKAVNKSRHFKTKKHLKYIEAQNR